MKGIQNFARIFMACTALSLFLFSCSEDNESVNSEEEITATELQAILETDDAASVVDTVLAELYMTDSNGAKSSNECYAAEYSDTGFTVVFENCVLNGTDNVNGTLTVTYAAEAENATFTATYEAFYVGDMELNGTRSYSVDGNEETGSFSFTVTSDMEVTMPDGATIAENGTKTFGFTFGESLETSTFTIAGNWTVFLDGNTYSVTVTSTLEGNFSCGYLTSGSMNLNKNGLEVGVDFGDGSCDDIATVSYPNGATEEISLKK